MGQADRSIGNFQFRKDKNGFHLAPIYDFEESFNDVYKSHYSSNLLGLDLDKLKDYPELKTMVNELKQNNIYSKFSSQVILNIFQVFKVNHMWLEATIL